jgi:hypothetical protein
MTAKASENILFRPGFVFYFKKRFKFPKKRVLCYGGRPGTCCSVKGGEMAVDPTAHGTG